MNKLEKILSEKITENGDISYNTTGNNLADLIFLTPFFEKHLDQAGIGTSEKEKLLSMYIRDPRYGLGRRDLGRRLMKLAKVSSSDIVTAGRFDDLLHVATNENLEYLYSKLRNGNELAKKWMPRLTGKDKRIAKALCEVWNITEKEYRKLIKTDKTVEYKLSYAEKETGTPLNDLFKQGTYRHPLVDKINFEQVPSLAMHKYLHAFSTREDTKERFSQYLEDVKANKKKVNVTTANVCDAYKTANAGDWTTQSIESDAREIVASKTVDNATLGVEIDAICILDTSGSMGGLGCGSLLDKATSVAHAIATKSTYAPNQLISFSERPRFVEIKGETLKEQYASMNYRDWGCNTDFGKVMQLLRGLNKFPEYLIVLSDMEFDEGSYQSKKETMELFKKAGANTKIIWWNFNDRNKTVPEFDEYGNIYLSGYNIQMLKLLENKFDMTTYIDKIIEDYRKKIGK